MALLTGAAPGTDIVFSPERLKTSQAFANKIWNAARFIFLNVGGDTRFSSASGELTLEDRWIRSKLNTAAKDMNQAIDSHRFHEAAQTIWHFIYDDFCDWYIELKKISANWNNLLPFFDATLRLLHPVMPFLTEELWHRMGDDREGQSISLQPYPQYDPALEDLAAEAEIGLLQDIVRAARNLRADLGLDPKAPIAGRISIGVEAELIRRLTNGITLTTGDVQKTGAVRTTPDFDLSIDVPAGQVEARQKRLEKEKEQLEKNIAGSRRQLSDEIFLSKAPEKIKESIRAKLAEYEAQLAKIMSL
jgi:valyl-tRNA synthetase